MTDSVPEEPQEQTAEQAPGKSPAKPKNKASTVEIELKFTVAPEAIDKIKKHRLYRDGGQGRAVTRSLRSIYLDSPDRSLERAGIAFRVRKAGAKWIQTLKTDADPSVGLFQRTELEAEIPTDRPEIHRISNAVLRAKVEKAAASGLVPMVETDVRRTSKKFAMPDGSIIQMDIDVGAVKTPDASEPVNEVELELVEGRQAALHDAAFALLDDGIGLGLSLETKAARGQRLLDGRGPEPVKADRPEIPGDATVEEAFGRIVLSCLAQILANEAATRDGGDPEGVHQMRVGVRRLRSAFTVFGKVLPPDQTGPIKDDLKWLFASLGDARDIDVFLAETLNDIAESTQEEDLALDRLRLTGEAVQAKSYADIRTLLDDPRYTRLLLTLSRWVAERSWRDQPVSEMSARLFDPIRDFAALQLKKRHNRVVRHGRDIVHMPIAERHEVRLEVKKLRYTVDFYSSLFGRKKVKPYVKALARIQETLGRLNDGATAAHVLERLTAHRGKAATGQDHRVAGYVLGWIENQARHELETLQDDWAEFYKAKVFW
ncbi:MAG: CYTH and CHAD domain-containing protein [Alphaproteobacteria bacterium]|nr:CYTH and CHAD domain-containing protein [Alphaproteobacteria bacterium]